METIIKILYESWSLTMEMAPYLLLGFGAAGLLHVFIPIDMIGRHLGKESVSSVIKASLFGIPIPLCSCGVLPVAAGIRKSGAGRASTMSFLITTPVTGVDSLMATWALLGWVFTIARIISSAVIGFTAGIAMIIFSRRNGGAESAPAADASCSTAGCCDSACAVPGATLKKSAVSLPEVIGKLREAFHYAFIELPSSFAGSLLFGLLLAGIITYFLPPDIIREHFGTGIAGILMATAIGIPLYVCSTGSIPIAAAMIASGFSPGAGLAFLIAGPATNTVAILAVRKILGNREMLIYLISIFIGAIGFGLLFDAFSIKWTGEIISGHEHHHISYFKIISGALLLSMIIIHFAADKYHKYFNKSIISEADNMNTITLFSPDISCSHCANTIKNTLLKMSGIEDVKVDVNSKTVSVKLKDGAAADGKKILSALEAAGYPSSIK